MARVVQAARCGVHAVRAGALPARLLSTSAARLGQGQPSAGDDAAASTYFDLDTHRQVTNQAGPLSNYNLFTSDVALQESVRAFGGAWAADRLSALGATIGSAAFLAEATLANKNKPVLRTHDTQGRRVNQVDFHPSYHTVLRTTMEHEVHSLSWNHPDQPGNQVARNALGYLMYQVEPGTQCPATMTYACVPPLQNNLTDDQIERCPWHELAKRPGYDPADKPATEKDAVTIGMSMTERQGGSDVRANSTFATPAATGKEGPGEVYLLNGHKWFTSAPMCDAFLTLAQTESGLSCFVVPRWIPGSGERNLGLQFVRLKDKLGDHSNASSEVEYHNAYAEMLGGEGRGIATILEMVQHTRIDTAIGSAALMRRCVAEAAHHTSQRHAFGTRLSDAPIMKNVISDLAVEAEAATLLAFRLASTFNADATEHDQLLGRIGTAVAKFHICKRAPTLAYEAMECLGGNGYVEDFPMARLYRQAPLNAIWEGSGNVICLDVLRCAAREPSTIDAFWNELAPARHSDERLSVFCAQVEQAVGGLGSSQRAVRGVVTMMAVAWQAALLVQHGNPAVAEAFLASRIAPATRQDYGTLPEATDFDALMQRALPQL